MKAVLSSHYGPPETLEIVQVPKPEPQAGEILIHVHATTVSRTDDGMLRPHPYFARLYTGLLRPNVKILGMDFAGTIEAVGEGVARFATGDRVFGLSPDNFGAHAEYMCIAEHGAIATMPMGVAFDQAVLCEGAWYADMYLKAFNLKPGQKILIYGGSGAIGTAAVQLAKSYGAEVTVIVGPKHLELAISLGADQVIDYTSQDFTEIGETFDFILDAVGKTTFFRCRKLLNPGGTFAATDLGPWSQNIILALWSGITGNNRVIFPTPKCSRDVIDFIKARMETGELRAVVDRCYGLDEIIEAYQYVETAQKTGIVVIDILGELAV